MVSSMDLDERHVYGCSDGKVLVWEKSSMEHLHTWEGLGRGLRITVDEDCIYCTSLYHFTVVDKRTYEPVHEAQFGSDTSSDLGHPINDDRFIYFPIRNGTVVAIDKRDYTQVQYLREHEGTVWGMDQSEDYLYTGSVDKSIRVWSKASLTPVARLDGHRGNVQRIHVSGPYLVSGATDLSVIIWERGSGEQVHRIRNAHRRAINGLASWGGRLLTSSMAEHRVRIWEMVTGQLVKEMEMTLAEGAQPRVDGDTVYIAFRDQPGVSAFPAEAVFR